MTKNINWLNEIPKVEELCRSGKTLREVGDYYAVSKQRIKQILQRYLPELLREHRGKTLVTGETKEKYTEELYKRTGRTTGQHTTDLSRAMAGAFTRKKQNAKAKKWGWSLTPTDILYPTVCPILGLTLNWFAEYREENSPSFDRIDPTKGYIPGNVIVCSWRANRIKNDGTAEEHRRIADYIDSLQVSEINPLQRE